jgi:anti-anti-sigma factor
MAERSVDFSVDLEFEVGTRNVTVAVSGDIDTLTAPTLAAVLHVVLDDGGQRIVVDLARCGFVDARGVAVFAGVAQHAAGLGGTVAIRSATASSRRLLDITRVSELVVMLDTEHTESPSAAESRTDVVDAALRLVTALAKETLANADGVSVTLERHGRLQTVAASNDKVLTMDRHQYETGEGPCLEARAQNRWYYIDSLADETRWPAFTPLALDEGIHSILSSPLKTSGRAQGALNIYSAVTHAFGQREQELAAVFAEQASEILTTAGRATNDTRFTHASSAR